MDVAVPWSRAHLVGISSISTPTVTSLPAFKMVADNAHARLIVKKGEMTTEVTSTDSQTFLTGTGLIQSSRSKPHFAEVDKTGDFLAILAVFLDALALKTYRQVSFIAFDPCTEATIKDSKGNEFRISKGMPPVIFELGGITREDLVKAHQVVADYAANGYRTLAAARTGQTGKWVMLGILPPSDPPWPSSKQNVADAAE